MANFFTSEAVRSIEGKRITSSYASLGSAFAAPVQIMFIQNTTDKTIFIQDDGSNDNYELPSGANQMWDFRSNSISEDGAKSKGTQLKVRGITDDLPECGKLIVQTQYL